MIERRAVRDIVDPGMRSFIGHHRLPDLPMEPDFLLGLASSPARVIDLWRGGERVLLGVVLDTMENVTDAAELVFLACPQRAIPALLFEASIDIALSEAARTTHANLEIGIESGLRPFDAWLRGRGFNEAYAMVRMKRDEVNDLPSPVDSGGRWSDLAQETVLPARELLRQAFAGILGINFEPEDAEDERQWRSRDRCTICSKSYAKRPGLGTDLERCVAA